MNRSDIRRPYFPGLDGLRGIAILLVVVFHIYGFIQVFLFGWLGVDLFFVLSGYLITDILLNTVDTPRYLLNFFIRRMLRVFPLYYLLLAIFLGIFPLLSDLRPQVQYYIDNQVWLWTYMQNWLYSFNPPPPDAHYLNHFWSLAIEEQFYLVWPFLILWVKNTRYLLYLMLFVLLVVMTARSILWLYKIEDLNYTTFYTFTRVDGICIGSMVALLHRTNPNFLRNNMAVIVTALAVLNFIFYFLNLKGDFPYLAFVGYTTFAALFGLLVYELVNNDNRFAERILTFKPLMFLGKISYGLYVYHWPLYILLTPPLIEFLSAKDKLDRILVSTITTIAAILLSIVSYYTFEIRFLKLKEKFR